MGEDRHREKLGEIRAGLAQLEGSLPIIGARQRQALELQVAGQFERAQELLNVLNDLQRLAQGQRAQIQDASAALVENAAQTAVARQR